VALPGARHGAVVSTIEGHLRQHVREHRIGIDRPPEVAAKVADYIRAGTQAVWVVDPDRRMFTVHTARGAVRYGGEEMLRDAPPLPELELPLSDLFM
jgi:hypothetical protein